MEELSFKKPSQNKTLNGIKTATQQMSDFYKFCKYVKTIPLPCPFHLQEKFIFHPPVDQCNKIIYRLRMLSDNSTTHK